MNVIEELTSNLTPTGNSYDLGHHGMLALYAAGSTLYVEGILRDEVTLILNSVSLVAPPPGGGSNPTCALDNQSAIVIVANFQNLAAPCRKADVDRIVDFQGNYGDSVNAFWDQNTFNVTPDARFSYTGVVVEVTIPYTASTSCNVSKVVGLADQAATTAGFPPGDYVHRGYVFPRVAGSQCDGYWSDGDKAKVKRYYAFGVGGCDWHVHAHEYGHNLGLSHTGVWGDEYAELSDVMGGAFVSGWQDLRHDNGPNKFGACFVPSSGPLNRTITDPGNGTFFLGDLAQNTGQNQVMRVTNIQYSGRYVKDYFFSYRQPTGFDANFGAYHNNEGQDQYYKTQINTFQVQLSNEGGLPPTDLLGFIGDGEEFRDYSKGLRIKQLDHVTVPNSATVEVEWNTNMSDGQAPTVKPTSFTVSAPTRWAQLSWGPIPHNTNPVQDYRGFNIYRNNGQIGRTPYHDFVDRGTLSGHTYVYYVRQYDDAGLLGPPSDSVQVTIP